MNYYIADWHYDHHNILAYDNRPFESVEDMNKALVSLWNETVTENDTVYVLGDMFWCKADKAVQILRTLKGHKVLIKGNHDKVGNATFDKCFDRIADYLEIVDKDFCNEGCKVVLCHYPIPCFKNHFHGWVHLYGHVHDSFEHKMMNHNRYLMEALYGKQCKMYNVGASLPWMNYIPRTLAEIVHDADKILEQQYDVTSVYEEG